MAEPRRPINIPRRHKAGIEALLGLSEGGHSALVAALQKAAATQSRPEFTESLIAALEGHTDQSRALVDAVFSFYLATTSNIERVEDFRDGVIQSLKYENLKPASDDWDDFSHRFDTILGFADTVGIIAKAVYIGTDHEHIYCNSGTHVLSEIRPVFGADASKPPAGAFIVHMLRFDYHQGTDVKSLFVALDDTDIDELTRHLARAKEKSASLKSLLQKANTPILGVGGNEE